MKYYLFYTFLILTCSCSINMIDSNSRINQNIIHKDSVVLLHEVSDSIYFTGKITKIIYPSNLNNCKDSLSEYSFQCLGNNLKIHVPCNYIRTDFFQYTEGEIVSIHYSDSSIISILCGTQADLSRNENNTNGYYFKKVIVKGYQITYENVPKNKLQLFNTSLELLYNDIK